MFTIQILILNDYLIVCLLMGFFCTLFSGESTLTEALTATGKTYEEIADIVAGQVSEVHFLNINTSKISSVLEPLPLACFLTPSAAVSTM